jgi:hypothetical protein
MDVKQTNGNFEETAAFAQILKTAFRRGKNWEGLSNDAKEALEQTATSIARILNGDPNDTGHWNRIAQYMMLRGAVINKPSLERDIVAIAAERMRTPVPSRTTSTMILRAPEEPDA